MGKRKNKKYFFIQFKIKIFHKENIKKEHLSNSENKKSEFFCATLQSLEFYL